MRTEPWRGPDGRTLHIPGEWTEHGRPCWTQFAEPTIPRRSNTKNPPELWSAEDDITRDAHRTLLHDIWRGRSEGAYTRARMLVHEIRRRLEGRYIHWPLDWPETLRAALEPEHRPGFWTAWLKERGRL